MHVAVALTEERLGWHVELVNFASWVPRNQDGDAALEAASTTTVVAGTLYVLWAVAAVGVLLVGGGCFWLITEVRPAVRQGSLRIGVILASIERAANLGQCINDDAVELATDGVANLLTVNHALEGAVGVGGDAAHVVGSREGLGKAS